MSECSEYELRVHTTCTRVITGVVALQSVATSKHVSRLCMIRDTLRTGCTPWKRDDNTVLLLLFVSFCVHTSIFYYKLQWVWHNDGFLFAWIFLFIWVHKKRLLVVELRFGWHIQLMSTLVSFFRFSRNLYKANLISIQYRIFTCIED